jgi:hypothetical protein
MPPRFARWQARVISDCDREGVLQGIHQSALSR